MATQQLVVRIVGDSKNLQTEFAKGSQAAKKFSVSVSESAQKSVASTVRQTERLRQLQAEYTRVARSATAGSAEQAAAAKLAADASRRLERTTASTTRELDRSGRSFRFFGTNVDRGARGILVGSGALGRLGRAATFASTAFIGGAGITFAIRSSSAAASNLAEQSSKAAVVFGRSANIVQDFARNSLGLATDEALASAAAFGALLRPLGITEGAAARTSTRLVQLALDLSSFSNVPIADSLQAIQSGLVGEVEPLRRFGILLSEARVQQEALAETGKRHVKQLTNQEKVQARLTLIFRDSAQAQGDFARTQGGLANQQRILQANIRDLEGAIGTGLNPAILDVTKRLNVWLGDTENQKRVQRDVTEAVRISTTIIKDFASVAKEAADAVGGFKNLLEILVAIKVASILGGWNTALRKLIGTQAAGGLLGASDAANTLRGRLLGLSGIAPISIPIVLAVAAQQGTHKRVEATISDFLRGNFVNALIGRPGERGRLGNRLFGSGVTPTPTGLGFRDLAVPTTGLGFRAPRLLTPVGGTGGAGDAGLTPEERARRIALRNTIFENFIGRRRDRIADIQSLRGQAAALVGIARSIEAEISRVHDRTRKLTLGDDLASVMRQRRGILEQIAEDAKQAAKDAAESISASLQFRLTKAETTSAFTDDLSALSAIRKNLDARIKAEGRTLELRQQSFEVEQKIADVMTRQRDARQFKTLGLGPTGETRVPGLAALSKELNRITEGLESVVLGKRTRARTRSVISGIRKALVEGVHGMSDDVKKTIAGMLSDLDRQLKDHATKTRDTRRHFDPDKLLAGLGLSPAAMREARLRLAQIGPGGTVPRRTGAFALAGGQTFVLNNPQFHGVQDVAAFEEQLRKRSLQRARARRGPYAGRN